MTQELANGIRICTVDVPYVAECIEFICTPDLGNYLDFAFTDGAAGNRKLPEGNWTLLGRFEEITEETWKGIGLDTESARSLIHGNPVVLIEKK